MKTAIILLFVFCYAECRKTYAPIDKNANIAFINMEAGGVQPGNARPSVPQGPTPAKLPTPTPQPNKLPAPVKPVEPAKPVVPAKPATPAAQPKPVQPTQPAQIRPKPVNPAPVANPITTPGPGSVKHLINFYDSQGKASPIRPYSYSQAVKQG